MLVKDNYVEVLKMFDSEYVTFLKSLDHKRKVEEVEVIENVDTADLSICVADKKAKYLEKIIKQKIYNSKFYIIINKVRSSLGFGYFNSTVNKFKVMVISVPIEHKDSVIVDIDSTTVVEDYLYVNLLNNLDLEKFNQYTIFLKSEDGKLNYRGQTFDKLKQYEKEEDVITIKLYNNVYLSPLVPFLSKVEFLIK